MGNKYSLDNIDYTQIKPLDLFNLTSDFTWDELKNAYKNIALKAHPDKGGNKEIFDYCTICFKELAKEYQMKHSHRSHSDLKQSFKQEKEPDSFQKLKPTSTFNNKNTKDFNTIFDQNKFKDEDDDFGYGDIMDKSTKARQDFDITNIFGTEKISNNSFNKKFDSKLKPRKDVIKYKEPEPLHLTKGIHFSDLGNKTDDYTLHSESNKLSYTDYMKAFSEERIPTKTKRKDFKTTKEYQLYSNDYIKKSFSSNEIKKQEKNKQMEETVEQERLLRLKNKDTKIEHYYNNISKLLLK